MNRIRDQIRRDARRLRIDGRPVQTLTHESASPQDVKDPGQLRLAIESMSEADQEIISLRHQAGLEFKAIAELLNEPVGTLLARHHRALHKLRNLLSVDAKAGGSHE